MKIILKKKRDMKLKVLIFSKIILKSVSSKKILKNRISKILFITNLLIQ